MSYPKTLQIHTDEQFDPKSLYQLMHLSESTLQNFYDVGVRLFENKRFQEAGNVFFVLLFLDIFRHNVWVFFGLCEQHCHEIDRALYAYSMAAVTQIEDPLPYLYSAQCCIGIAEHKEARAYLQLATDMINEYKPLNSNEILKKIDVLKNKL